jgi:signal transduction histidine kinase
MPPPTKRAASAAAQSPRARLGSRIVVVGAVLIAAFVASSAFDAWRLYRQSLAAIDRELVSLARAIAEQTAHSFQTVDVLLRDTRDWYVAGGAALAPERVHETLVNRAAGLPQVRGLTVVDANGALLHSSRQFPPPAVDVSDRPYFTVQRDTPTAGLFVSEPLVSRVDNRIELVLSRRLDDGKGRFAGVMTALVDLEDFQRFYRAVDVGAGSTIILLRPDGTLIVREPPAPAMIGTKLPEFAMVRAAESVDADGRPATLIESPIDRARRFVAVVRVREFPLVLMVGRDEKVALGAWRSQATDIAVRTVAVTLLALLLIAALVRQLRRVDAGERALHEIEVQLRQSQKMEAMGTLAGGIAHDFNNILGAILGYSELAQKDLAEGTTARRYVDQVMHAGNRAKVLVERILAFSRIRPREQSLVNVQAVVAETLDLLAPSLPPHVTIESRLEAGDAAVAGDATELHEVAMNLCTNAVQAMQDGGVLTVALARVDVAAPRSLSHGRLSPGPYVRLRVRDTGPGMPPAIRERMFDPFFTTKGVGEGTGLGLSLVHGIVADLEGAIHVTTAVGHGAAIEVWLPVAGEVAPLVATDDTPVPRGNGETVMIVDDEKTLVALAEEILAELGYEPVGYASSIAALQAFRAVPQRFDLVLVDETMPDLAGTDLADEIQRLRPGIPVVLMSGHRGAELAARAATAGVRDVLQKPLTRRDIAVSLERALR